MKRALVLLPIVLVAAGCGSSSEKDQVKSVVQSYVNGLANSNGKQVCDQLAGSVQTQVQQRASAKSCAAAITTFQKSAIGKAVAPAFKTAKIDQIQVKGNNATAQVTVKVAGKDTPVSVPLEKVSGSWKISSTNTG